MEVTNFYNLISEVNYPHISPMLLSHRATMVQCERALYKGLTTRRWGMLGAILKAGHCIIYLTRSLQKSITAELQKRPEAELVPSGHKVN